MRSSEILSLSYVCLSFCFGAMACAQANDRYVTEPLVIERLDETYRMQPDGTGVFEKSVVVRVQAVSTLKQLAVLSLPFASNSEHVEWVSVKIRHKDGGVTETPAANAIEVAEEARGGCGLEELQQVCGQDRVGK